MEALDCTSFLHFLEGVYAGMHPWLSFRRDIALVSLCLASEAEHLCTAAHRRPARVNGSPRTSLVGSLKLCLEIQALFWK
jgi:hypothetical protein